MTEKLNQPCDLNEARYFCYTFENPDGGEDWCWGQSHHTKFYTVSQEHFLTRWCSAITQNEGRVL